jgi:flagellar hook-length control protein FliK
LPTLATKEKPMAVTIVSSLPAPAPAATAVENTSSTSTDTAAASLGFASLLFGQLTPLSVEASSETPPETKPADAEASVADTNNLLAALGIIPAEVKPVAEATTAGSSELRVTEGKSDASASARPLPAAGATENPKASAGTTPVLENPTPAESGDKAAKFAVTSTSLPVVDSNLLKKPVTELSAPQVIAAANGQNSNANALTHTQNAPLSIPTPVRDQNWSNDFSQKVVWLAGSDKQSAQITLNPPQMGPIEVSLNMDKGSATATFVSANAEVRDAIETAMPRLREMFASAGIELGQTNVGSQSFQQQAGNSDGKSASPQRSNDNAILVTNSAGTLPIRAFTAQQGNGFVDIFA